RADLGSREGDASRFEQCTTAGFLLIVDVPFNPLGFIYVYIDDMISLFINKPGSNNLTRLPASVLMAIHAVVRTLSTHKTLPLILMVMKRKLKAEAGWAE
ncbi:hypothetical protein ACHAXS_011778, partial [Conticribra weissflogii]